MQKMNKVYNPKEIEDKWYKFWEENGFFHADINKDKKPFTIMIPLPNITGILHMGHVLNNTLQDIMIRYYRMKGREALWMPGTDHAGIATQNVVERELAEQGKTRFDIGREKLVELIWKWKAEKGGRIIQQLKKLGASCDWARERFTMDKGLSNAVKEVFVKLYEKGLIYKGEYIINWCPRCGTALSDDEVDHEELNSHLWYVKYPIKDEKDDYVIVATTRPETMLGDTAVAVNPNDERFKHLIGKTAILPILNREIPIIADEYVDPEFGTGCVKVTPAHDPNDFEIGNRHNLERIIVMDDKGIMNENAGVDYKGMNRFECREKLVEDLKERRLLVKIEPHKHTVGHCYRCHTVIEPYLSKQWFVKMKPLAQKAIDVVKQGKIKFQPERWEKVYYNWMDNIRDWCISRQIWWGHRIPAYYCQDCGEIIVAKQKPEKCIKCKSTNLLQDPDVLDTWFSSWLWPFTTLGWPEQTPELEYFYPTNLLITNPGIIFFWVARMIMAGLEFVGDIPFDTVLLHGTVLDEQGRRMSKSLGNSPDPIDIIDNYGADALRFAMIFNTPKGQDVIYSDAIVMPGRNFANKIWNASRFALMNADKVISIANPENLKLDLSDRWILSRMQKVIADVNNGYQNLELKEAAHSLYSFFWGDFCDWYLELTKNRFYGSDDIESQRTAKYIILKILDYSMRMLHPFMPFISEEIWQRVVNHLPEKNPNSVMIAGFPEPNNKWIDESAEKSMDLIKETISAVRNIKKEMNIPLGKKADLLIKVKNEQQTSLFINNIKYIQSLADIDNLKVSTEFDRPSQSASAIVQDIEIYLPLAGLIDFDKEKRRLHKKIDSAKNNLIRIEKKLQNIEFLNKAPEDVINKEKQRREEYSQIIEKLDKCLNSLDM